MTQDNLTMIRESVAEAMEIGPDEVSAGNTLFGDLEMESIDLLDVFFRIEQTTGVSMSVNDLGTYLQGGIPDDEFSDESDVLTDVGLQQLDKAIPEFESAQRTEPVHAEDILGLVTVSTLDRAVSLQAQPTG